MIYLHTFLKVTTEYDPSASEVILKKYLIITKHTEIQIMCIFTRGQFWPSGIVVACVCPCVRQS